MIDLSNALTIEQAADFACCSERVIAKCVTSGELPSQRFGNKVMLDKRDVIEFMAKRASAK